jgi:hypothetical protein
VSDLRTPGGDPRLRKSLSKRHATGQEGAG